MPGGGQKLCYNCFQERPDAGGPCPYCGFDLAEHRKKYPLALRPGTVLNDRYVVGRVLGQGGFGITYLAFDTQLEVKVAVKEFLPGEFATRMEGTAVSTLSEERSGDFDFGLEQFRQEARTLARFLSNPNIAGVSSVFGENGTAYFVMEYIEGISFKSYIANHGGKISPEEALNVMIPVLRALTAVHQAGLIHRDVTPDNIYITKDGMVKLLDFGASRYSMGDKSRSLDVVLKEGYAPKEQYTRRGRQGPFTDVYSCAACLYAALTGYVPPESLERLEEDTLVPVSRMGVDIPEYLDRAILKGLAVQQADRFQTAAEFLEVLENQQIVEVAGAAAGQPELARAAAKAEIAAPPETAKTAETPEPASAPPEPLQTEEPPAAPERKKRITPAMIAAVAAMLVCVGVVFSGVDEAPDKNIAPPPSSSSGGSGNATVSVQLEPEKPEEPVREAAPVELEKPGASELPAEPDTSNNDEQTAKPEAVEPGITPASEPEKPKEQEKPKETEKPKEPEKTPEMSAPALEPLQSSGDTGSNPESRPQITKEFLQGMWMQDNPRLSGPISYAFFTFSGDAVYMEDCLESSVGPIVTVYKGTYSINNQNELCIHIVSYETYDAEGNYTYETWDADWSPRPVTDVGSDTYTTSDVLVYHKTTQKPTKLREWGFID